MATPLYGISERDRPSAAMVPNVVAKTVASVAIKNELAIDVCQISFDMKSSYHRIEYADALKANMSALKVKYGSALKLSGIITKIGAIRNKNTTAQIKTNNQCQMVSIGPACCGRDTWLISINPSAAGRYRPAYCTANTGRLRLRAEYHQARPQGPSSAISAYGTRSCWRSSDHPGHRRAPA